ncbi:MAG TPA: acyl carrier protein [Phycisphaerales bacterium]|nr:acyl carrier protein [Phycisphaerales bacterium]
MQMANEEIFSKVQAVLVDALAVDDDEVTPEATLTEDLGAESIDFLDIVFRLEKAFEIKIDQGEIFPSNVLEDEEYVKDGKVTDAGMAELRKRMPHAQGSLDEFDANRDVEEFSNIFTVDTIVKFIEGKVG